jgi:hypothetical protein
VFSCQNRTESPHVKMGVFHTLELEQNRKFTITKVPFPPPGGLREMTGRVVYTGHVG